MKKLIASVVIALSFSFSAQAVKFDHWKVADNNINSFATLETGADVGLIVYSDASVLLGISPKGGKMGKLVHSEEGQFVVDNQPIKATIKWHENGGIILVPLTDNGHTFVTNNLWSNQKITIKFKEFEFWVSAKGVQKAWRNLHSVKKAI